VCGFEKWSWNSAFYFIAFDQRGGSTD
jgi:hypothetical protein